MFTTLGGDTEGSSLGVPVSFNIQRGRTQHQISVNYSRSSSATRNQFTGNTNISALAGIQGISDNPFSCGPAAPHVFEHQRPDGHDAVTSERLEAELHLQLSTAVRAQPPGASRWRLQIRRATTNTEATPTAPSSSPGSTRPTAATAGSTASISPTSCSACRSRRRSTTGLAIPRSPAVPWPVRPGRLAGQAEPDVSARPPLRADVAVRRRKRATGQPRRQRRTSRRPRRSNPARSAPYSGAFPAALLLTDTNNLAQARASRGGRRKPSSCAGATGFNYNSGTYSGIARQLAQQPPFATTGHQHRFAEHDASDGERVDRHLAVGHPEQLRHRQELRPRHGAAGNVDMSARHRAGVAGQRQLHAHQRVEPRHRCGRRTATSNGELRIEGVQPFTWQSSEGQSVLNSATFQLQKRQTRGSAIARSTRSPNRATTRRRSAAVAAAAAATLPRTIRTSKQSGRSRVSSSVIS